MAFQGDSIFWVEVEKVVPNPFQPRREFDEAKLKELAESVRMYGILQPLTVTRRELQNEDGSFRSEYELIAGERRLRASKIAGLAQVPVIIREGEQSEQEKLELAIIENLQREDLNAVDRALAFRQLADVFGLSHTQVAQKVGRSREYVSNTIRLLALPDYMLNSLRLGDLSEGHARTLLMLNDRPEEQDTVFREILLKKLSVREVERIARGIASEKIRKKNDYDADLVELEKKFTETLGTRVSISKTEFGGRVSIDYFTPEDLEMMLERMRSDQPLINPLATFATPEPDSLSSFLEPRELANPRADELLVLTNSTGLELVPEDDTTNYEHQVADATDMNTPDMVAPEVAVESDTTVDVTSVETEPFSPEVVAETEVIPSEAAVELPPLETISDTEQGSEQSFEAEPVFEAMPVAEVLPVMDESVPDVVSPELVIPAVVSPEVTPATTESVPAAPEPVTSPQPQRSSLRDQLAALLGQTPRVVPPVSAPSPAVAPVMPTPVKPVEPVVVPSTVTSAAQVAPVAPVVAEADDSTLYDLKNFSI